MPLYSVNDLSGGNPGENRPTPRTLPEPDESRTMPIPRIGRRKAERRRLLLLGSVGALLVAAPIALIGFFDDQDRSRRRDPCRRRDPRCRPAAG
ncbi:hypothetical protein [Saccharopolyspora gregorii]|uniref:hypothetical protein n=1 Tax=Saccharopolyspora gregorii TaxID=33914 RepID=UPI0021ABFF0C|nr:hypothetical protein [Saccharopolyspora gregorii]